MHIPPPGMEMGQLTKKVEWKEKWRDSRSLAINETDEKLQMGVHMIDIAP